MTHRGFLAGAVLPVIPWALYKRFPKHAWLKLVNFPVLLHGASIPPQIPNNVSRPCRSWERSVAADVCVGLADHPERPHRGVDLAVLGTQESPKVAR